MYLGQWLGKKLYESNEENILWNSIGIGMTGLIKTLIYQAFDSLAGATQNNL